MTITEAMNLLAGMQFLRITNRSAHVYPKQIGLGCLKVRRKRGEALIEMVIRLAEKAMPFDREYSREEIALLYSGTRWNEPPQ